MQYSDLQWHENRQIDELHNKWRCHDSSGKEIFNDRGQKIEDIFAANDLCKP